MLYSILVQCVGADQTFTFNTNLRSRRSVDDDDVEPQPKQSTAFMYGKPLTSAKHFSPLKGRKKVAVELLEAIKDEFAVNNQHGRPLNTRNGSARSSRKSQSKKLKIISNQVKTLEKSVMSLAEAVKSLQATVASLKTEVKPTTSSRVDIKAHMYSFYHFIVD